MKKWRRNGNPFTLENSTDYNQELRASQTVEKFKGVITASVGVDYWYWGWRKTAIILLRRPSKVLEIFKDFDSGLLLVN